MYVHSSHIVLPILVTSTSRWWTL